MGMLVRWGASTSVAGRGSRMAFSIKSGNHARKGRGKEDEDGEGITRSPLFAKAAD